MNSVVIVQVVRRFGRVGGMESYVWELVHGLSDAGRDVVVVCDEVIESPNCSCRVIQLPSACNLPRWVAMLLFRRRVVACLQKEFFERSRAMVLVHSHERCGIHDITTFHGPPMKPRGIAKYFSWSSPRVIAWKLMERQEVVGARVKMVVAVSNRLLTQLSSQYPSISSKTTRVAWPGVSDKVFSEQKKRNAGRATKFLFVGFEYKRKGLDLSIEIVRTLRRYNKDCSLTVYGPSPADLTQILTRDPWIRCAGWVDHIPWGEFDVLLHPAREEPFGMVVSEARSHGVPVVMSSNVGAADIGFSGVGIVDLGEPLDVWVGAVLRVICPNNYLPETRWTWSDLVEYHLTDIYPEVERSLYDK